MDIAQHSLLQARPSGMTPRRALIVGTVGLLHIGAIYALVMGMTPGAIIQKFGDIQVVPIPKADPPQRPPEPPPRIDLRVAPTTPAIVPPDIEIAAEQPPVLTLPPGRQGPPLAPDSAASGIGGTHSSPPYPALAARLGHQGQVQLRLAISAAGDVSAAAVVKTSGFDDLDQAAIDWVVAHWRYKPAIRDGVAVPSQSEAIVKFDLRQIRG